MLTHRRRPVVTAVQRSPSLTRGRGREGVCRLLNTEIIDPRWPGRRRLPQGTALLLLAPSITDFATGAHESRRSEAQVRGSMSPLIQQATAGICRLSLAKHVILPQKGETAQRQHLLGSCHAALQLCSHPSECRVMDGSPPCCTQHASPPHG
ncbi:unnamed protein product [Arctogadus glacialis]